MGYFSSLLVIDDRWSGHEEVLQKMILRSLEQDMLEGKEVTIVASFDAAFPLLQSKKFDLVITDLNFRKTHASEACEELRQCIEAHSVMPRSTAVELFLGLGGGCHTPCSLSLDSHYEDGEPQSWEAHWGAYVKRWCMDNNVKCIVWTSDVGHGARGLVSLIQMGGLDIQDVKDVQPIVRREIPGFNLYLSATAKLAVGGKFGSGARCADTIVQITRYT